VENRTAFRSRVAVLSFFLIGGCVVISLQIQGSVSHQTLSVRKDGEIRVPLCGQPDDAKIHIPPDWATFNPPPVGQSYVDPVFACRIQRLTDSGSEETLSDGTHPSLNHYYSTFSPMNSSDSMLLIGSNNGAWRIKSIEGRVVVPSGKMPTMNNGHPLWDAADGSAFYYTHGKTLYTGIVRRNSVQTAAVHTFKEYRGIVSPDAADLSQDGDHIALVGQNADNTMDVFVWSLNKHAKTSTYTTVCTTKWEVTDVPQPGCVHKLQLSADNLLLMQFAENGSDSEQGLRLWNGSELVRLQDGTNHCDTGYDLDGKPVFIEVGRPSTLPGESNPCPSGWGLDVRRLDDMSSAVCLLDNQPAWHVSYRGDASQPWAAISFFDDRKSGPELFNSNRNFQGPSQSNWQLYEDEIILARVDGKAIYRLAHARSRSAESYWATPRAALSRDGRYVIFSSNMAHPNGCPAKMHVPEECTDVFLIKVR